MASSTTEHKQNDPKQAPLDTKYTDTKYTDTNSLFNSSDQRYRTNERGAPGMTRCLPHNTPGDAGDDEKSPARTSLGCRV